MVGKLPKLTYEDMERRFQSYCKHDGGRTFDGTNTSICAICRWDTNKCQHRKADGQDKYCRDCGAKLIKE